MEEYRTGFQHTIRRAVACEGIGLHSGRRVSIRLQPAEPHTGVRFLRRTATGDVWIEARVDRVSGTTPATTPRRGAAGVHTRAAPRSVFVVPSRFEVRDDTGWIAAEPAPRLEIHNTVEYDHPAVGRQVLEHVDEGPSSFI